MRHQSALIAGAASVFVLSLEVAPSADPAPHFTTTWRFEIRYNVAAIAPVQPGLQQGLMSLDVDPMKSGPVTISGGMRWNCSRAGVGSTGNPLAAGFICSYVDAGCPTAKTSRTPNMLFATVLAACSPSRE